MNIERNIQSRTRCGASKWISSPSQIGKTLVLALVFITVFGPIASAQSGPRIIAPGEPRVIGETLNMEIGTSVLIQTPWNIKGLYVANERTANVTTLPDTLTDVLVIANALGKTSLIVRGEGGQIWSTEIVVAVDLDQLNSELATLFPLTDVAVTKANGTHFATGTLANANQVRQLSEFMAVSSLNYVDMTKLAGVQQVQLKVRVAEVNRVAIKRMGINALHTGDSFFGASLTGSASGGAFNPVSIGPAGGAIAGNNIPFIFTNDVGVSPFATLLAGFPGSDLEFFIQALAENQYLQILAEPTLVALSGEEASFLAGGEFPIPVVQGSGAGGGTSISIDYKEFGVRLGFRPIVMGNGIIRLHVSPEVSDLSDIGAVEIQGFRIPAILTRRATTTLELRSGQTFAMAGLLLENTNARNSRVPLLGDLPILGSLFRSVSYQRGQSELVVLVTATLVEPLSHANNRTLPGEDAVQPNDWEIYMLGQIEGTPEADEELHEEGEHHGDDDDVASLGKLKGPGAWVRYEDATLQGTPLPSATRGDAAAPEHADQTHVMDIIE